MFEESLFITLLFLIGLLAIWVPWIIRHKIQPFFGKRQLASWLEARVHHQRIKKAIKLLNKLYRNTNPFLISKASRLKHGLKTDQFLYGEIHPLTLIKLIDMVNPEHTDIFYDLGSGAGKAVLMADMCYDFKQCKGIEMLPALYQLAQKKLKLYQSVIKLQNLSFHPHSEFIQGDFLKQDLTPASIIFINATAYKGPIWDTLADKLKHQSSGCHIIVTSLKLNLSDFELLFEGNELMSWGFCSVRIYRKI